METMPLSVCYYEYDWISAKQCQMKMSSRLLYREIAERKLASRRISALPYKYRKVHITVDQVRKFQVEFCLFLNMLLADFCWPFLIGIPTD